MMEINEITLQKLQAVGKKRIPGELVNNIDDITILEDFFFGGSHGLIGIIRAHVWGEKKGEIQYPANWKEAFKERWFPCWLKKRFPIKYTKMIAAHLYPNASLPEDRYGLHSPVFFKENEWPKDDK